MDSKKWEKIIADYERHCIRVARATTIKLGETAEQKSARMKRLEANYIDWFEYYFAHYAKCKCAKFHKKLADYIIDDPKSKTLGEIYRSGAKSVHADLGIPLFLKVVKKSMHFMLLMGETLPKAKRLLGDIQAELMHNQKFINDYGRKFKEGDWADGDFHDVDGDRYVAMGFGQSPRGLREGANRPDYIVVDDCDSKKHINNDRIMREYVDYIMEDVIGCFDSSDDSVERFVFVNNNFHKNSITNRLKQEFKTAIAQDKQDGVKSQHKILTVCAVKDLVSFEPTWPEKSTAQYWRQKYNKRRRSFLREFMHMHVSEGKIWKPEYFQWKKMLPLHKYDALCLYGDLSYKTQGDFKGLMLIGKIGREIHIIHVFLRQTSRTNAAKWLYDLYEDKKLSRFNIKYKFEGLFAQDEFVHEFDNEGDERGYHIPIIPDKRGKANKEDRIESTEGYFERHWVWFNEAEKESVDQIELIEQYMSFEKGSDAHDDGPDAVHGGIDEVNRTAHVEKFPPRMSSRADVYNENDY
jgi:predicted phage terminase large subunit-like protein